MKLSPSPLPLAAKAWTQGDTASPGSASCRIKAKEREALKSCACDGDTEGPGAVMLMVATGPPALLHGLGYMSSFPTLPCVRVC